MPPTRSENPTRDFLNYPKPDFYHFQKFNKKNPDPHRIFSEIFSVYAEIIFHTPKVDIIKRCALGDRFDLHLVLQKYSTKIHDDFVQVQKV